MQMEDTLEAPIIHLTWLSARPQMQATTKAKTAEMAASKQCQEGRRARGQTILHTTKEDLSSVDTVMDLDLDQTDLREHKGMLLMDRSLNKDLRDTDLMDSCTDKDLLDSQVWDQVDKEAMLGTIRMAKEDLDTVPSPLDTAKADTDTIQAALATNSPLEDPDSLATDQDTDSLVLSTDRWAHKDLDTLVTDQAANSSAQGTETNRLDSDQASLHTDLTLKDTAKAGTDTIQAALATSCRLEDLDSLVTDQDTDSQVRNTDR